MKAYWLGNAKGTKGEKPSYHWILSHTFSTLNKTSVGLNLKKISGKTGIKDMQIYWRARSRNDKRTI